MKIGILGSGMVGTALAEGFLRFGHHVKMGSRTPGKLSEIMAKLGTGSKNGTHAGGVSAGTFSETAVFGELLVLATKWDGNAAKNAVELAGKENFRGKVLIDVTNPLKSESSDKPPILAIGYPDSAGKTVQSWLPETKVVKAFNIVTSSYMTNPKLMEGEPDLFIAGDSAEGKQLVTGFAEGWGWKVHDMGGVDQAYLLEALAMIWIRYGFLHNHWTHAFQLLKR